MVDTPLDRLLQIGYDDLHKNQAEFTRIAKEVDPGENAEGSPWPNLPAIHPPPDQLLQTFHNTFNSLIAFIQAKKIITIPSTVQPTLEETPPFMSATTQASMDSPGPYEKHSSTAYFNVTLPEKNWPAAKVADYMSVFNVGTVISTSVHEAYPGHYVQFLWVNHTPMSAVRKLTGSSTNIEGWAHYCEQMMLDEGYNQPGVGAKDERESRLIRLGQLQDALLRDARFVVGIRMHTQDHDPRTGAGFLRQRGLPVAGDRGGRNQARNLGPDLPLLHAGQAGDHEAAVRPPEERRERASHWRNFTTTSCARAARLSGLCARRCWGTTRQRCRKWSHPIPVSL